MTDFVICPSIQEGRRYVERRGLEPDDAVYITSREDAQGRRLVSGDHLINIGCNDPEALFYLTCHLDHEQLTIEPFDDEAAT